jgi:hypothetical protein
MDDVELEPIGDDQDDGTDNQDQHGEQQDEPTFSDWLERGAFAIGTKEGREGAEDFSASYGRPEDLLEPGALEHIAAVREISPQTADALEKFRGEAQAEADRVRDAEAQSSREAMKAALQKELEEKALVDAKAAEDERIRQDLLDEIARDAAAAGGETATFEDAQVAVIEQALEVVHDLTVPLEERAHAAEVGIAAAAALEEVPFVLDRKALDTAVQEKLARLREG